VPNEFHQIWWIFSESKQSWGGLRIAHFRKTTDGTLIFFIAAEPPDRMGPRLWEEISNREGWVQVKQIMLPSVEEVKIAIKGKSNDGSNTDNS